MLCHLLIPALLIVASILLLPSMGDQVSLFGWISAGCGLLGGFAFWLLPFPTPPLGDTAEGGGRAIWVGLPWWRTLMATVLLALGLTAVMNMLLPAAFYNVACSWQSERGSDGAVVIVAADSQTRDAQGGSDEAVMRAQMGEALRNLSRCEPKGVFILRVFSGETEGDYNLAEGFRALLDEQIPIAYLTSPQDDDPEELKLLLAANSTKAYPVSLDVPSHLGMDVAVDAKASHSPIAALVPQEQEELMWLLFGKPMHPLYSMTELNQGCDMQDRRDPKSEAYRPYDTCEGKIVILTELLSGGVMHAYNTPISETMPAHQFWALALDSADTGATALPLSAQLSGLWAVFWALAGAIVSRVLRKAGAGIFMAILPLVASMLLLMWLGVWTGIMAAVVATAFSGYVTRRYWRMAFVEQ